jgi:hypothetical protein
VLPSGATKRRPRNCPAITLTGADTTTGLAHHCGPRRAVGLVAVVVSG